MRPTIGSYVIGIFLLNLKFSFTVSWTNPGTQPLLHACGECNWPPRGQQVSHQRWIWGIYCMHVRKHASKGSTLALKPRADAPEVAKTGNSSPTKWTRVLQTFFLKKKKGLFSWEILYIGRFLPNIYISIRNVIRDVLFHCHELQLCLRIFYRFHRYLDLARS